MHAQAQTQPTTPALTPLDARKLAMYDAMVGPMGSSEAIDLAIEAECIANACGPFDIAYHRFKGDQQSLETYALLLERAGR